MEILELMFILPFELQLPHMRFCFLIFILNSGSLDWFFSRKSVTSPLLFTRYQFSRSSVPNFTGMCISCFSTAIRVPERTTRLGSPRKYRILPSMIPLPMPASPDSDSLETLPRIHFSLLFMKLRICFSDNPKGALISKSSGELTEREMLLLLLYSTETFNNTSSDPIQIGLSFKYFFTSDNGCPYVIVVIKKCKVSIFTN